MKLMPIWCRANGPTCGSRWPARLRAVYVGAATQPTLIVHDLKRGADAHGNIGLGDNGTDGHFRNLSVHAY